MDIPIIYFSAAGGTEYILQFVKKGFTKQSYGIKLLPIAEVTANRRNFDNFPIFGIASPVYDFNFSQPIRNWIKNLPSSLSAQKVFLIDTTAGLPCDSIRVVRKILVQKNYEVIGALEVLTPMSEPFFNQNFYPVGWKKANIDKAYFFGWKMGYNIRNKAEEYIDYTIKHKGATKLTNWVLNWERQGGLYDFIRYNKDSCIQCGKCEKSCPMGIINLRSDQVISEGCIFCATCVRNCPVQAIYIRYRPNAHLSKKYIGLKGIRGYIDPDEYHPPKTFSLNQNYWRNY